MQEFPRKLQDLMGAGYDVRNFGDCCASVIGGYVHSETHPYVSGSNYKAAVAFLPDIVLIAPWGRHDWGKSAMTALASFTVPAFQTGYEDILTKFQALSSKPKIIVSNLVPLPNGNDGPDNGYKTSPQRDVVVALAAKYNLQVVDTFTVFSGPAALPLFIQPPAKDSDGEHTSDAGSTKMAELFAAALKGMGGPAADAGAPPPVDAGTASTGGRGGPGGGNGGTVGGGSGGGGVIPTGSGGAPGSGGASVSTGGTVVVVSTGGAGTGGAGTGGAVQTVPTGTGGAAAGGTAPGATDAGSTGCACRVGSAEERAPWGVFAGAIMLGLAVLRSRSRRKN
jgi:MYXO-CTERM domain-containing protein